MAGLLVSVRSAEEASSAVEGGAEVVDVKEPDNGPLGRASSRTWSEVRRAVPEAIPVSVALGELIDWTPSEAPPAGIAFRKLGLAGSGPLWRRRWAEARRRSGGEARWVAVVYADWLTAGAPAPEEVLDEALAVPECSGVLVDTWDKARPSPLDASPRWADFVARARGSGRLVALAGRLDLDAIARLAGLRPDLFAVRGAACGRGDRRGVVESARVARLVAGARRGVTGGPALP